MRTIEALRDLVRERLRRGQYDDVEESVNLPPIKTERPDEEKPLYPSLRMS
ncbi:hypothetical protein MCOR02_001679 [Pyricularia oryzae]|nr:hypothetical protein MCOR02_001679 [Pyricularia oryzae]